MYDDESTGSTASSIQACFKRQRNNLRACQYGIGFPKCFTLADGWKQIIDLDMRARLDAQRSNPFGHA